MSGPEDTPYGVEIESGAGEMHLGLIKTLADQARPAPAPGQVWKEVDPRMERFVRVISVVGDTVKIETVKRAGPGAWVRAPRTRIGEAQLSRFRGRRGGYEYVVEIDASPDRR